MDNDYKAQVLDRMIEYIKTQYKSEYERMTRCRLNLTQFGNHEVLERNAENARGRLEELDNIIMELTGCKPWETEIWAGVRKGQMHL